MAQKPKIFLDPPAPGGSKHGGKVNGKEVSRGTQDELEIIMMIVAENLGLKMAVLEKVRQVKYRLGVQKKTNGEGAPLAQEPTGKAAKVK